MSTSIQVVVRFRPLNETEKKEGPEPCIEPRGINELFVLDPHAFTASAKSASAGNGAAAAVLDAAQQRQFTFDHVFQPKAEQEDLFGRVGKPVVDNVLKGYNGTILAYGQTGSGKTHSMLGPEGGTVDSLSPNSAFYAKRGVIPRLVEELFARLSKLPEQEVTWKVSCSVFELYKEQILDLLTEGPQQEYRIREDIVGGRGVFVDNLYTKTCFSASELLEAVRVGVTRRKVGATKSNATSSRSHSLTVIALEQVNHVLDGTVTTSRLTLVDLAGSEKVGKTQADGERLKEAQMINLSLTLLGNVIYKLTDGKSGYIPYRDSKLTRILQDSFGGNSITTLLCHCSPAMYNREETLSTLRFASRAKQIRNKPVVNRELSQKELQVQLAQALDRIKLLEGKLAWQTSGELSPRRHNRDTSSPNKRETSSGAREGVGGTGGSDDSDDLKALVESLLKQIEDLKLDLFQREEDMEVATKQVEFYKLRAAEAEEAKNEVTSRAKREEAIAERKFADLLAENKSLQEQIAASRKQVANAITSAPGSTGTSANARSGSASNLQALHGTKSAPGTPVDSLHLDGAAIKARDSTAGKKPSALRKLTGDSVRSQHQISASESQLGSVGAVAGPRAVEAVVTAPVVAPVVVAQPTTLEVLDERTSDVREVAGGGDDRSARTSKASNGGMGREACAPSDAVALVPLSPAMEVLSVDPMPPSQPNGSSRPSSLTPTSMAISLPPKAQTVDFGVMAVIGPTVPELERSLDELNRNMKTLLTRNSSLMAKEKELQSHLERLGAALEVTKTERDDNQQELDALRSLLDSKEKENNMMRRILQELNINIEEHAALLGNEKERNQQLLQTQEQQEYADMASMELLVKTEDINDIERDLHIIASTEDKDVFESKRHSCLETLGQLKAFLDHLTHTLTSQKFNTGTLESRRLCLVSDAAAMIRRVEEARSIIIEFGSFDGM